METLSLSSKIMLVAFAVWTLWTAWTGWRRRRAYWTVASWLSFSVVFLSGVALLACVWLITEAIGNHETWVGSPHTDARSGWTLLALAAMFGGIFLSAGSLQWFADGEPTKQFPLLGLRRLTPDKASPIAK